MAPLKVGDHVRFVVHTMEGMATVIRHGTGVISAVLPDDGLYHRPPRPKYEVIPDAVPTVTVIPSFGDVIEVI